MADTITKFVEALKKRIRDNGANYFQHHSWLGDTEGGFYDVDEFDFDALLKDIDEFSASFKKKENR